MRPLIPRLILGLILACTAGAPMSARPVESADGRPVAPFPLYARSGILVDQATGRVLFEHDADQPMVPASLAKLMSLHIVYEKLEDRTIHRDDVVAITSNAFADNQEPGSSLMNLGPGQIVTVEELMKGMAVASGNDAATALAEYVAGSTEKFVRLMNEEARFMGYTVTHFTDPSGVGEGNRTTAREFADFCRRYIDLHPQALEELHSLREFDYPLLQNMADGRAPRDTRKQFNPNFLVWDDFGVDGLKTGHLDNDNFTAAITARRGDMRLIAVLLGVPGSSLDDGARNRSSDGLHLLSYGFRNYSTIEIDPPTLPPVRVWKGTARGLALAPLQDTIAITVRRSELEKLAYTIELSQPLVAPVARGRRVGYLVYTAGSIEVGRVPLAATAGVESAGPLRRAWDSVILGLSTVVGGPTAALRATFDTIPPQALISAGGAETAARRLP